MMEKPPSISIVIPTFNEAHNLSQLVERLDRTMRGVVWEVVFVDDDSPDKTWKIAQQMALRDGRVRCIRRVGRRGLAGACIEGMLSSAAPYVAVMDGDLQHDEAILPDLLGILERDEADVAIGSRHVDGEAGDSGFSARRAFASRFATRLASVVIGRDVSDPMSGFFVVKREVFENTAPRLLPSGFKILLDLLASADRPLRVKEVGYRFRTRQQGQSKFDAKAVLDFLALLVHRWTRGVVPIRFLFFAIVGAIGIGVHLTVLRLALVLADMSFGQAQTVATFVAMTSNFFVNNLFTYRDKRLRGLSMIYGLLLFYAVCGIGAFANVGVASFIFAEDHTWWVASIMGIIVGTAFNYTMSSIFVWRHPA
jgi:dolichol-phosphate mannosyltransferase